MKELNVLIIDDDKKDRVVLIEKLMALKKFNYDIVQVNSTKRAMEYIDKYDFDLVFLDFMLGDDNGLQFLSNLPKKQKKKAPIIFITSFGNLVVKEDSIAIGARAYLNKNSMTMDDLSEAVLRTIH